MSGYSFKVEGDAPVCRGWIPGSEIFTTPEFQKRYDRVRISLLTPKCTLVPEQFFEPVEAGRMLSDVVKTEDNDLVEYIRAEQFGAVLIFSNSIGESLSRAISHTVLTVDGFKSKVLPEMYYILETMGECTEYNKIVASWADGYLHLAIGQGKNLMLANIFKAPDFTTAEYFIFNAMKKLQLNPEMSTITFRTPLSENEEMSLYRYFRSVEKI
ncbi:MAG: DUF3822 family protein [Candidatus Cryptobacteroides sp.]